MRRVLLIAIGLGIAVTSRADLRARSLEQPREAITGTIAGDPSGPLPGQAVLRVLLERRDFDGRAGETLASFVFERPRKLPFEFSMPFDRRSIVSEAHYTVRAMVTVGTLPILTTETPSPVLTYGAGTTVRLRLQRTDGTRPLTTAQPLRGTLWSLVELNGRSILLERAADRPTLTLENTPPRLVGFGGCSHFGGKYTVKDASLTFGPITTLRMTCPSVLDVESEFITVLSGVRAWRNVEGRLELLHQNKAVLASFEAYSTRR